MTRRMVSGPISTTRTLLERVQAHGKALGGMPGSLTPRGVLGSASWFADGESYITGRLQRWELTDGGNVYALTLFDDSPDPAWELDARPLTDGTTPARLQTTRTRLAAGGAVALALGLVLVLVVVTSKGNPLA
jgi:hypothetical protein